MAKKSKADEMIEAAHEKVASGVQEETASLTQQLQEARAKIVVLEERTKALSVRILSREQRIMDLVLVASRWMALARTGGRLARDLNEWIGRSNDGSRVALAWRARCRALDDAVSYAESDEDPIDAMTSSSVDE